MSHPKFPSEEQGGYDPIPTHPEPNSPQHNTVAPQEPEADEPSQEKDTPPEHPDN